MPRRDAAAWSVGALLLAARARAFYVPGTEPRDFARGDELEVRVGRVASVSHRIPFDLYDVPSCRPDVVETHAANIGEVLAGDVFHNSAHDIEMLEEVSCRELCTIEDFDADPRKAALFRELVDAGDYRVLMRMDNLPGMYIPNAADDGIPPPGMQNASAFAGVGHPLGFKDPGSGKYYVNNHVTFWIAYHVRTSAFYEDDVSTVGRLGKDVEAAVGLVGRVVDGKSGPWRPPVDQDSQSQALEEGGQSPPQHHEYYAADPDAIAPPGGGSGAHASSLLVEDNDGEEGAYDPITGEAPANRIISLAVSSASFGEKVPCEAAMQDGAMTHGFPSAHAAEARGKVRFTYSVRFVRTSVPWVSRWEGLLALQSSDADLNWSAIGNAVAMATCMTFLTALMLMRSVRGDIDAYRKFEAEEEKELDLEELEHGNAVWDDVRGTYVAASPREAAAERPTDMSSAHARQLPHEEPKASWKLLAGDVYRPPSHPLLLSVLYGIGSQITYIFATVLIVAMLGFFSPSQRGVLLTTTIFLLAFFSYAAGFDGCAMYKTLRGKHFGRLTTIIAAAAPAALFAVFAIINTVLWFRGSSGAVEWTYILALLALWGFVSVPLTWLGGRSALKRASDLPPLKVNTIPRFIPVIDRPAFLRDPVIMLVSGALLFSMVFVHIFFLVSKLWLHEFAFVFGFVGVTFLLFLIASAEVAIVNVYLCLCYEDHQWWWRAFLTPATVGVFTFVLTSLYVLICLPAGTAITVFMMMSYVAGLAIALGLMAGSAGLRASYVFVRNIYGAIKCD